LIRKVALVLKWSFDEIREVRSEAVLLALLLIFAGSLFLIPIPKTAEKCTHTADWKRYGFSDVAIQAAIDQLQPGESVCIPSGDFWIGDYRWLIYDGVVIKNKSYFELNGRGALLVPTRGRDKAVLTVGSASTDGLIRHLLIDHTIIREER